MNVPVQRLTDAARPAPAAQSVPTASDTAASAPAPTRSAQDWVRVLARYREPDPARSAFELAISVLPFIGIWALALWALSFSYLLAFALGVFIMESSGSSRFLILVGISSVICAIAYTGGPFPLAYNGLGDVFVILFFGFVAVGMTHYVLLSDAGEMWVPNWLIPLGTGFMINNLLVVNNYRDRKTDQKVRKNTSVVLLGKNLRLIGG